MKLELASLAPYLGATPCRCGRCRPVGTERVRVGPDLADALREELADRPALLFGDPRTLAACGTRLAVELDVAGADTRTVDLEATGHPLHADDAAVARAARALEAAAPGTVPVAVGSGTVNDVVKAASHDAGRRYVAVATAPSMNGYTSAIAAITRARLKETVPSLPPVSVLADPAVLAASPPRMRAAGLADLLSKPVSSADWRLGALLWGEPFCPTPVEIAGRAVDRAVAAAPRLAAGDVPAALALFEALLLSGIAMAVAGSSSPASGGEHLISHFLDMDAPHAPGGPRTPALHGEQVGVATRVTTRLYAALLNREAGAIDWDRAGRSAAAARDVPGILERHAPWLPAALRERFHEQGARKLERLGAPAERVRRIRERWDAVREALAPDVAAAERYVEVLPSFGPPLTAAALGVGGGEFRAAYRLARWVRDRYTVLDLAGDLGLLESLEHEALGEVV